MLVKPLETTVQAMPMGMQYCIAYVQYCLLSCMCNTIVCAILGYPLYACPQYYVGASIQTYGRSIYAALDEYHIDRRVWHELAADRSAWRETLRLGHPPGFVAPPPTPPLALTRPTRRAAIAATCGIDASLRALRAPLV